jgi:hypothetical protein
VHCVCAFMRERGRETNVPATNILSVVNEE